MTGDVDVVRDAVHRSLTAEFATVRNGRPATVPLTPFYDADRDVVVVTASPAFAGKAERAAANDRVSLLLHGGEGRVHLTGRATVRDADLEANAAEVERLVDAEPATPKRAAMRAAADFLGTRLGLLLLDWYGLRILVDVDPVAIDRVDAEQSRIPAWPEVGVDSAEATTYDRAVATVVNDGGWPRTWPLGSPTLRDGRLRLDPPDGLRPADGHPACVLLHWHAADLSTLGQRLVRGRCRPAGDDGDATRDGDARAIAFDPASSFRLRNETPLDFLRFVVDGKRRTRAYYADRGETYWGWPGLGRVIGW